MGTSLALESNKEAPGKSKSLCRPPISFLPVALKQFKEERLMNQKILGTRWFLTWKHGNQYPNLKKAKARGLILGHQDPLCATRPTLAPTPTRSGRQPFWQFCNWEKFKLWKGDSSGPFLQGKGLEEEVWRRLFKAIAESMGFEEGTQR